MEGIVDSLAGHERVVGACLQANSFIAASRLLHAAATRIRLFRQQRVHLAHDGKSVGDIEDIGLPFGPSCNRVEN